MNYIEKVKYMSDRKKNEELTDEYYIDIRRRNIYWQTEEIEEIIKDYPYLPEEYITFIKEFDNLGLSFVTFYGSKKGDVICLSEQIEEFKPYLGEDYFPFAKHADGSVYVIDLNQQVKMFYIDDYEFEEEPEHIADNFVEFIDEYLLGEKGWQEEGVENIGFYKFLKKLGWIK